ncbi:hypothetical protein [Clostridium ihumii]|nr:hypothetical protein [Clostridium ihumii]
MKKRNLKCYIKLTINDEQLTMKDKTEVSVFKINFYDNLLSKLLKNNIKT